MNSTGSVREVVSQTVKDLSRRIQQQQNAEQSLTSKTQKKEQPVEISLSVDAISLFRLSKIIGMASMGFFGAFGATLRLLAPIIVARRCLAFVAYAWLDHYNGRFLRTTYNDRLQDFQKYEIPSVLRSCGRSTTQLVAMGIVGRVVREILKRMPCWMPSRICQQFYGVIWACLVLLARRGAELWFASHLETEPVPIRKEQRSPLRIVTRPWHILQWMKDPEELITSFLRPSGNDSYHVPFQPDSLLFPSTWPPSHWLSIFAMAHIIQHSPLGFSSPTIPTVSKFFCLQYVLYTEWYRILFRERRVLLGVAWGSLYFLAAFKFVYSVATADGFAGVILIPNLLAGLVSIWMNCLLYNELYLNSKHNSIYNRVRTDSRRTSDTPFPLKDWMRGNDKTLYQPKISQY